MSGHFPLQILIHVLKKSRGFGFLVVCVGFGFCGIFVFSFFFFLNNWDTDKAIMLCSRTSIHCLM